LIWYFSLEFTINKKFDISFVLASIDGINKKYESFVTVMQTGERQQISYISTRNLIFIRIQLTNKQEEAHKIDIGHDISVTGLKFPIVKFIAPQSFEITQLGVSKVPYQYDSLIHICHKSCLTCIGRRAVDCLSCFNGTNLTIYSADTGKCIYEHKSYGEHGLGILDWAYEYIEWIFMIVFVLISAIIIYVIWYTCCRTSGEKLTISPTMNAESPPHLELHEEKP